MANRRRTTKDTVALVSHSAIFYWWPAWGLSLVLFGLTHLTGTAFSTSIGDQSVRLLRSPAPGTLFAILLILIVIINSVHFRKWGSLVIFGLIMLGVSGLAWLGWLDSLANLFPALDVRMSSGFYLLLSALLGGFWLVSFCLLDRLVYWRVRGGALQKVWLFRGVVQSHDLLTTVIEKRSDDFLRHFLFGFGSGDLDIRVSGDEARPIRVPNVLNIGEKLRHVESIRKQTN